jgi:hypothetical protein
MYCTVHSRLLLRRCQEVMLGTISSSDQSEMTLYWPAGALNNVEFGTVEKSLAKCPADPPSAGTWQYKSSVLGRYSLQLPHSSYSIPWQLLAQRRDLAVQELNVGQVYSSLQLLHSCYTMTGQLLVQHRDLAVQELRLGQLQSSVTAYCSSNTMTAFSPAPEPGSIKAPCWTCIIFSYRTVLVPKPWRLFSPAPGPGSTKILSWTRTVCSYRIVATSWPLLCSSHRDLAVQELRLGSSIAA